MMPSDTWEQGSEFHCFPYRSDIASLSPWDREGARYGSGRDAFKALLLYGQRKRDWKQIWIPSYYCQDVVSAFLSTGIEVAVYSDSPLDGQANFENLSTRAGDVVLNVNYFGLRTKQPNEGLAATGVEVIEDHTHDPWSTWAWTSNADWCVASLRKTLPVPDGGILWSPISHKLPPEVPMTAELYTASLEKWAAMALKRLYLEGVPVQKELFRSLATSGERRIGSGNISGISPIAHSLLPTFPVETWRKIRLDNHRGLSEALQELQWLTVLQPEDNACPFSGILIFDTSERRDYILRMLINSRVYPAILWLLEKPVVANIPLEHVDLSQRLLAIHIDVRYAQSDMKYVASLIHKFGKEFGVRHSLEHLEKREMRS